MIAEKAHRVILCNKTNAVKRGEDDKLEVAAVAAPDALGLAVVVPSFLAGAAGFKAATPTKSVDHQDCEIEIQKYKQKRINHRLEMMVRVMKKHIKPSSPVPLLHLHNRAVTMGMLLS